MTHSPTDLVTTAATVLNKQAIAHISKLIIQLIFHLQWCKSVHARSHDIKIV